MCEVLLLCDLQRNIHGMTREYMQPINCIMRKCIWCFRNNGVWCLSLTVMQIQWLPPLLAMTSCQSVALKVSAMFQLLPVRVKNTMIGEIRDLRVVFSFELNLESNRLFDSFSNLIFKSNRPYTTQAVTQPNGLQAYRRPIICWRLVLWTCVVFVVLKATGNLAWMMEWTDW